MRKKVFCIAIGIRVLLFGTFQFFTTGSAVGGREKQQVQALVEKALRVKYGWKSKAAIQDISTTEFQERMEADDFYEGFTFYTIERDFMESCQQVASDTIVVRVRVYAPDIIIPIFTLKKMEDGRILIADVEYDI